LLGKTGYPYPCSKRLDLLNGRLWELAVRIHNLEGTRLLLIEYSKVVPGLNFPPSSEGMSNELSVSTTAILPPGEEPPVVGSRFSEVQTRSGCSGEKNNSCPFQKSNLYLQAHR
jgi:hypothetical protein